MHNLLCYLSCFHAFQVAKLEYSQWARRSSTRVGQVHTMSRCLSINWCQPCQTLGSATLKLRLLIIWISCKNNPTIGQCLKPDVRSAGPNYLIGQSRCGENYLAASIPSRGNWITSPKKTSTYWLYLHKATGPTTANHQCEPWNAQVIVGSLR